SGRAATDLVIARADGSPPRQYSLPGNLSPEAFSSDTDALFVIQYSPPMAPDRYRVRRLDLATGTIGDVASPDADLQADMRGTAQVQSFSPDGNRLYTLYTRIEGSRRRAFVHVLSL